MASDGFRQPFFSSPGAPQGPRAFCFAPLAELAIRACLRNMFFRVRIPGGVPGFAEALALPHRSGIASGPSGSFFYNSGCGNTRAGMAQREERDAASVEKRVRGLLPAPIVSVV